jgi:DNA-binding transcriptional regulator PaaX
MEKLRTIGKAVLEPNGFFSLDQIVRRTGISRKYTTDTLVVFSKEGLIKKIRKQRKEHVPGHSAMYSLTYRVADRKALAQRIAPKLKEDTAQDKMWKVIRYLKIFTRSDLIRTAAVSRENAKWYTKMLHRAGFIRPSRSGGGPGVEWRLIRDCGPKRPYVTAKGTLMEYKAGLHRAREQ